MGLIARYRVIRYQLKGPDRGNVSVFADRLPGIPDDVFTDTQGRIWVTLVAPRDALMDNWIAPYPYIARLISLLPWSVQNGMLAPADTGGRVVRLSETGGLDCTLRVSEGPPPANGLVRDGQIMLGRLGGTALISIDPQKCDAGTTAEQAPPLCTRVLRKRRLACVFGRWTWRAERSGTEHD